MSHSSKHTNSSWLGLLFREGTALGFAGLIWYIVWGGYEPNLVTSEEAFRSALFMGLVAIAYLGIQALAVVMSPVGRVSRYLLDLLVSVVPLFIVGFAAFLNISGELPLTFYQKGALWFSGAASFIDVLIFTWFNLKVNRLSHNVVLLR